LRGIEALLFLLHVGLYYLVLLLNRELVSRVKLCLVSAFPDIVKDCPKMRNLPKIILRSFKNVDPGHSRSISITSQLQLYRIYTVSQKKETPYSCPYLC